MSTAQFLETLSIVLAIISFGVGLIRRHTLEIKSTKLRSALGFVLDLASTAIDRFEPVVRDLKNKDLPGVWNQQSQSEVKKAVFDWMKTMGKEQLELLKQNAQGATLDDILEHIYQGFQKLCSTHALSIRLSL
jgi:hypothetical protein